MHLNPNPSGHYHFATGIAPYSAGVIADTGYEIVRVVLGGTTSYVEGFDRIDGYLGENGLPRSALCAVELRLPRPLTFDGFAEFNRGYRERLDEWGLLFDGANPIARTNVAPLGHPPGEPLLHAFSVCRPSTRERPTFIVAGAGELVDQARLEPAAIVRPGESSDEAIAAKVSTVLDEMRRRLVCLGVELSDVTRINVYTPLPRPTIVEMLGAALGHGSVDRVHWIESRPPIEGLDFEMDLHGVVVEEQLEL